MFFSMRLYCVFLLPVVAQVWGCTDAATPLREIELQEDAARGEILTVTHNGDEVTVLVGTEQRVSVAVMQPPRAPQPLMTRAQVTTKLMEASTAALEKDSSSDHVCCLTIVPFVIEVIENATPEELRPQDEAQTMALLSRQLATFTVVESIAWCGTSDPAGGCSSIAAYSILPFDVPAEHWLHELIHARGHGPGNPGVANDGHRIRNDPDCAMDLDQVERGVMCDSAPLGRVVNETECKAALHPHWPEPRMVGSLGSSSKVLACRPP